MPGSLHTHLFPTTRHGVAGRRVRVWTPTDYTADDDRRYPVVYLQDGQNLFDAASAFAGVAWQAHKTAQRLIDAKKIQPLILVGIDNSGAHRADDYTVVPWLRHGGGHAAAYAQMLVDQIKPFVDRHYRTRPGPESTGLGGSSLGGLFALHSGLSLPHVFGNIAALSPSVFWGDHHLLRTIAKASHVPIRIWIDAGKRETPALRKGASALATALLDKGWLKHRTASRATLRFTEVPGGRHDEASWGRRFARVLRFLFPIARPARRPRKATRAKRPTG
jgi:predicted alpha/beta superfamily hydrolase